MLQQNRSQMIQVIGEQSPNHVGNINNISVGQLLSNSLNSLEQTPSKGDQNHLNQQNPSTLMQS